MTQPGPADWIAADWGTSRLRAWAMRGDSVIDSAESDAGMGRLAPDAFEPALIELVSGWLDPDGLTPVVACGMVGARQGWVEASYRAVPSRPFDGAGAASPVMQDRRLSVFILPGLSQAQPADVMRGEETQIAGFLAAEPGFDGVICLPGTHSKWVRISAGEICHFATFMTGEIFDLLSRQSVLRHSVTGGLAGDRAFVEAVSDAASQPGKIAGRLFGIRAADLLHGQDQAVARARLSGWMIGMELAGAKPYWLGQDVAIIGAPDLAALYQHALLDMGAICRVPDAESLTLAGLISAHAILKTEGTLP